MIERLLFANFMAPRQAGKVERRAEFDVLSHVPDRLGARTGGIVRLRYSA